MSMFLLCSFSVFYRYCVCFFKTLFEFLAKYPKNFKQFWQHVQKKIKMAYCIEKNRISFLMVAVYVCFLIVKSNLCLRGHFSKVIAHFQGAPEILNCTQN